MVREYFFRLSNISVSIDISPSTATNFTYLYYTERISSVDFFPFILYIFFFQFSPRMFHLFLLSPLLLFFSLFLLFIKRIFRFIQIWKLLQLHLSTCISHDKGLNQHVFFCMCLHMDLHVLGYLCMPTYVHLCIYMLVHVQQHACICVDINIGARTSCTCVSSWVCMYVFLQFRVDESY